jgi:hypothetical protein
VSQFQTETLPGLVALVDAGAVDPVIFLRGAGSRGDSAEHQEDDQDYSSLISTTRSILVTYPGLR